MRIRWRGLELPSLVTCDKASLTPTYGKFVAEPFERGFGATIGNSLRRILLSSLEGSSITQIQIHGAQHEFTTLPGVVEDVTDIVLNLKSLIVKNYSDATHVIRIKKNTHGLVTGADVQTDEAVVVVNKDHVVATLTQDVSFEVSMIVGNGRGYVPATEHTPNPEHGNIPVDAVYSPVTRVRYEIEETRVGQKTNYDRLTLEIWTNGSIGPEMAMVEAAKILRKHLSPFVQYHDLGAAIHTEFRGLSGGGTGDSAAEAKLNMNLADLKLSVRAMNCLEGEQINTVRDLVSRNEDQLLDLRNFGETTLNEVREKLAGLGLRLGMRVPAASAV